MGTMQWLGEVEDRMVRREYVTPAERIAQQVRRKVVDAGGPWAPRFPNRLLRPLNRRYYRKAQRLRAKGWTAGKIADYLADSPEMNP